MPPAEHHTSLAEALPEAKRTLAGAFLRFVATGAGAATVDLGLYTLLIRVAGLHPLVANLISRPAGGLFSFTVNKLWTFADHDRSRWHIQFAQYVMLWLTWYALSEGLLGLFHSLLGLHALLAKPLAEGIVALLNFVMLRHWVFRERPTEWKAGS
ncbi:MAG: GtrA family protein [Phycisphaerae bacterium]|nr:GtrA family protein [Phycisphaerae bacterium]